MSPTQYDNLCDIHKKYLNLADEMRLKYSRARKEETKRIWRAKLDFYSSLGKRCFRLLISDAEKPINAKKDYEDRQTLKKIRRERFENRVSIQCVFDGEHLGADYGTFECEDCSRDFSHSPRRILKNIKIIKECVCGRCAKNYSGYVL
jgi:hypothetical protein